MGLINAVLSVQGEHPIEHCGLVLLTIPQAITVVLAAKVNGVGVLGIEAFEYRDNVRPLMDWIADYSSSVKEVGFVNSSCSAALCFLDKLTIFWSGNSQHVFVELVLA